MKISYFVNEGGKKKNILTIIINNTDLFKMDFLSSL